MQRIKTAVLGAILSVLTSAVALAAEPVQQHNSNAMWFENWIGLSNAALTVSAPNGKITQILADQGTPVFELSGEEVQDGVYRYELTAATEEKVEIVNAVDSGREGEEDSV